MLGMVLMGLLLLFPATPHHTEAVLCIEPSGEVNIEHAEDGECAALSGEAEDPVSRTVSTSDQEHCTNCSDVPLRVSEADDPCGRGVVSPSIELEGPSEQEALVATTDRGATGNDDRRVLSHLTAGPARSQADPGSSLGSVVLLI